MKYVSFSNKKALKNGIFKLKNNYGQKNEHVKKNNNKNDKNLNHSYFNEKFRFHKINIGNNDDTMNETKEILFQINKSLDKGKGKCKLIIKKANKIINKPKSTPKLLLTHPSFKDLFL